MVSSVCFIHVCATERGIEILIEQINKIKKFGLYNKLEKIYLGVLGDYIKVLEHDIYLENDKIEVIYFSKNMKEWEFPTLSKLKLFCDSSTKNYHILYIHTKGIIHNTPFVEDWRNFMEYFLIERHEVCLNDLLKYDAVGVNYHKKPWNHYSGNFWWANSYHIKKLVDPDSLPREGNKYTEGGRWNAEKWLLSYYKPEHLNGFNLVRGFYGNNEKRIDVTGILLRRINNNRLYIKRTDNINVLFGDPCYGKYKYLEIIYKMDGDEHESKIILNEKCNKLNKDLLIDGNSKVNLKCYHESGIHHYKGPYPRSKYEIK